MNSTPYADQPSDMNKHDACIRQAGIDYGIVHCLDGTTHWFLDDYSRNLRAAVKLAAQIFNGRRMFFSEQDLDGLIGRLKMCRNLPSPDRDVVAVIDVLLRKLLPSDFGQLVSAMAGRREMDMFIRDLFEQVCHEGARTQAVARAIQWQRHSSADWMAVRHAVDAAFAGYAPIVAHRVALLRKAFVPANEEAAYSLHECAKDNEVLFQREMSGEKLSRKPASQHRPDVAMVESNLHALKTWFDSAVYSKELLRGGVITVNFSRVHGLYLDAVLLVDGRNSAISENLTNEVKRLWEKVTEGDSHVHMWSEIQCSWCGVIEPDDTAKKSSLLLELECRALREKYVRAKGSEALPTFTLIQTAMIGLQRGESHDA